MGRVKTRTLNDGRIRHTAYYFDGEAERSAGTYAQLRDAQRAWRRRERELEHERRERLSAGRRTLADYVQTWFPAHPCEPSTRQSYAFWLERYVVPVFGHHRLARLTAAQVRTALARLAKSGASRDILEAVRCVLGAIYTTAVTDQIVAHHPCRGVKLPRHVRPRLVILSPEELDLVLDQVEDPVAALMIETAVETGCRWGELAELRAGDFNPATATVHIDRVVIQLKRRFHPTGGRFLVKNYPKNGHPRTVRLRPHFADKLADEIARRNLNPDNLLFPSPGRGGARRDTPAPSEEPESTHTAPNARGRRYRHGTKTGYNLGGCRCRPCRDAIADYRANRRAHGHDRPRTTPAATDQHMDRNWFRTRRWQPALHAAGIDANITFHGLRHTHASWLLEGGASIQTVADRLGHTTIRSTMRYLHTLPTSDDTALRALDTIYPSSSLSAAAPKPDSRPETHSRPFARAPELAAAARPRNTRHLAGHRPMRPTRPGATST